MDKIREVIERGNPQEIRDYLLENGLRLDREDDRWVIVPIEERMEFAISQIGFWHARQQARKILLNSLYGALLNEALRFSDERMGQSVTLTGRSITRHMNAETNRTLTGEYDFEGQCVKYSDTDSLISQDEIVHQNGRSSIEDFFNHCAETKFWSENTPHGVKEYAYADEEVLSYDPNTDQAVMKPISYVYRHKVSKPKWRITDQLGNSVTVTGDHSVMIMRDGKLIEAKPKDIIENDLLISVK